MNTLLRSFVQGGIVVAIFITPFFASAATFTIADGDVQGLINAINTANSTNAPDTINLASGGTYISTTTNNATFGNNAFPTITSKVTFNGNGSTIQRSTAIGTPPFRFFAVNAPKGDLTINNVTLSGGRGSGGAIINLGKTEIVGSIISNNVSPSSGGGGLSNSGSGKLKIVESTVTNNTAAAGGGGIINSSGDLTVVNSTISSNTASYAGGGIASVNFGAKVAITNSTISGNTTGTGGQGGGVYNSTFSDLKFFNSTIVANSAPNGLGGGICSPQLNLARLKNTVVANNSANGSSDCYAYVISQGHNLIENTSGCTVSPSGVGDIFGIDPNLGTLASNGGVTFTHLPLVGSPVINAVPLVDCNTAVGSPLLVDQRGVARPQPVGGSCDIGSVEVEPPLPPPGVTITNNMTSPSWGIYDMFNTLDHVKVIDLAAGNYLFVAMEGFGPLLSFTVGADGTVTSPACLPPTPYAECGNSYFTVNGFPVNITGFPLSNNANISPTWSVNNIPGLHAPGISSVYNLIPGNYQLYTAENFGPITSLTVGTDGIVTSPACLPPTYATCGSLLFSLLGFPATIVSHLSTAWGINNVSAIQPADSTATYNLIPGAYQLYTDSGFGPSLGFTVDSSGYFQGAPADILDAGSPQPVSGNGTSTLTLGGLACTPPPAGLLAWWPGDGNSTDIVGGYNGTLQGAVSYVTGKVAQAFSLFEFPDEVSVGTGPSATDFTIDTWVRISQYQIGTWPYQTIYANNSRGFWLKDGHLNWWAPSSDKYTGTSQIPLNTWTHIALTYSGGTFTSYVNGVLDGTSVFAGESLPMGSVGIGGHSNEIIFGDIDELQIFSRALSQSEIQAIVDAGSVGQCK